MKKVLLVLFIFVLINLVLAHQPRIVEEGSLDNPIIVEKPEISKAYYGNLNGEAEYYKIESEKDFNLYINILAPNIDDSRTDFEVEVIKDDETIFTIKDGTWEKFYEPFGGDEYLQGPEVETKAEPGIYIIKVSNPDNQGKYSLAVGKIESFPLIEIIKTLISLPKLKKDFFNKSPLTAYFNLVGLFLLIFLIIIVVIIIGVFLIIKRKRKIRRTLNPKT